ncbi:MAG: hypothetical protein ABIH46_02495 [Chloroflexota bacterium]
MHLIALDVDGTLASAGGLVDAAQIERAAKIATWGILSSRSIEGSMEACKALGVEPAFVENCRVDMRCEELKLLMERYPGAETYIYVADRDVDRAEALRAGWDFRFHHRFGELLEEIV